MTMGSRFVVVPKLLFGFFMIEACCGDVLFSSLPQTLLVSASPNQGQVLRAGEDSIAVTWSLKSKSESYEHIKAFLCYAPISQVDRPWRKTVDNLSKDKTCQFPIFNRPYESSMTNQTVNWVVSESIPGAAYFIRAYAYDSSGREVAYGQTADAKKTDNLFEVQAITGINWHLEAASILGCVFPLVSLLGFWLRERSKSKGLSKS